MSGAVTIWHDIAPEGLTEFYAWHGEEHMPERVAIPGFQNGRRFMAKTADLQFFTLYETQSPEVFSGAHYKARLDNPTPRTLSAVRHFRNVARSLCRVLITRKASESGIGQAGLIATLRYDVDESQEAAHLDVFQQTIVPRLATSAGVCTVSLLVADRTASGYVNAEQRARGTVNAVPSIVLLVEGWADEVSFSNLLNSVLGLAALEHYALSGIATLGIYTHQLTVVGRL